MDPSSLDIPRYAEPVPSIPISIDDLLCLAAFGLLDPERDDVTCSTRPLKLLCDGRLAYQGVANHNMIALTTAITAGGNSPSTRQVAASRVRFNRDARPPGLGRAAGAPWPQPRPP